MFSDFDGLICCVDLNSSRIKLCITEEFALEDGPYEQKKYIRNSNEGMGRTNFATSGHMLGKGDSINAKTCRSSNAEAVEFQINLRHAAGEKAGFTNAPWRRCYTRSYKSFDQMAEEKTTDKFAAQEVTPEVRRPDRNTSSVLCTNLRAGSDYMRDGKGAGGRADGCEGSALSTWRGLTQVNPQHRSAVGWCSTLRGMPDSRNDSSLVDMMGKKKQWNSTAKDRTILLF